jgi:hypothetical protein
MARDSLTPSGEAGSTSTADAVGLLFSLPPQHQAPARFRYPLVNDLLTAMILETSSQFALRLQVNRRYRICSQSARSYTDP